MWETSVAPESMASLEQLVAAVEEMDAQLAIAAAAELIIVTEAFAEALRISFSSHNKTGETMAGMKVDPGHIEIGGGGPFVEFGTPPHVINAKDGGPPLHWVDPNGGDVFARQVYNPGYAGDPFVERAVGMTDLGNYFVSVMESTFSGIAQHRMAAGAASRHYLELLGGGTDRRFALASAQGLFASILGGM